MSQSSTDETVILGSPKKRSFFKAKRKGHASSSSSSSSSASAGEMLSEGIYTLPSVDIMNTDDESEPDTDDDLVDAVVRLEQQVSSLQHELNELRAAFQLAK